MAEKARTRMSDSHPSGWLSRLRERGVLRVAASYAVIAWLALQIADVTLEPLGLPKWVMTALIIAAAVGFPIAIALAWFLEIGEHGIERDTAAEGVARPRTRGFRHYADAIVIGVLLISVAVLLVRQSDLGKPEPPENPAIAVLPFENLSGDPEQEYFSDGLAEEVLDRLGRVPGLKVIARSSSFGFKGKDVDARTIAEKLGVTTLLEGSVRRDGQRLKLNARLIDGATGQQLWSGSFDRELTNLFAVQAELAGAVVGAIVPTAKGSAVESAVAPTTDLDAYDLYLAAKTQLAIRTEESIRKSVDLSEQAVRLDPQFARGQAQLAHALLFQALWDHDPEASVAVRRRAETAVHRALALDPDLSEAHGAYANLLRDTERPGAEEQYRRAIELNQNNAFAWHDYSVYLGNVAGRPEESDRARARALELDPRQPVTWANHLKSVAREGRERYEAEHARAVRTVGDMPGATDRFPFVAWTRDRHDYRDALLAVQRVAEEQASSAALTLFPGAVVPGFPLPIMRAARVAQARDSRDDAPAWVYRFRGWQAVDLDQAARALPGKATARGGINLPLARLLFEAEIAGLLGDWARLDAILAMAREQSGDADPLVRSIMAFWLAVQGRHEEASQSLTMAEPIPLNRFPPMLGSDRTWGLMDTVIVRIHRATGRDKDADRVAAEGLERMRPRPGEGDETCTWQLWEGGPVAYASLAANEGLKQEAVRALELAMRCGDLPFGFWPQLPWFLELEGYAPYDALLRERESRIARLREELLSIDPGSGPAATAVSTSPPTP